MEIQTPSSIGEIRVTFIRYSSNIGVEADHQDVAGLLGMELGNHAKPLGAKGLRFTVAVELH